MDLIRRLWRKYRELIIYLIVGVATTLVNWIAYAVLTKLRWGMNVSNILAWVAAVVFAFFTNKIYVFESRSFERKLVIREAVMFVSARTASGVLEIIGMPILLWFGLDQPFLGVDGFLAKIMLSVIVMVLNYVFSKLWIFKKKS